MNFEFGTAISITVAQFGIIVDTVDSVLGIIRNVLGAYNLTTSIDRKDVGQVSFYVITGQKIEAIKVLRTTINEAGPEVFTLKPCKTAVEVVAELFNRF